jgi:gliding motility-associated-like protein
MKLADRKSQFNLFAIKNQVHRIGVLFLLLSLFFSVRVPAHLFTVPFHSLHLPDRHTHKPSGDSSGIAFTVRLYASNPNTGNDAIEGCNDIVVAFLLETPATTVTGIGFSISGSAVMGEDYLAVNEFVNFQSGDDSASIIIRPLADTLPEGTETVEIRLMDAMFRGIADSTYTIVIRDRSEINVDVGEDVTSCPGQLNRFVAHVEGGIGPFTFSWNTGQENDSTITVAPLQGIHQYIVEANDQCGSADIDSVVLNIETVARLVNDPAGASVCTGDSTDVILVSNITRAMFAWQPSDASGNITGYSAGSGDSIRQQLRLHQPFTSAMEYSVSVTAEGCTPTDTVYKITVNPKPQIELGEPVYAEPGTGIALHAGGGFDVYQWSDGSADSVIRVSGGGKYWVDVTDLNGCSSSDTVMVYSFGSWFPNAFTPNGDGLNDRFRIAGFEGQDYVLMQVFDRWGVLVCETHDLNSGWDGTFSGQPCPEGTYVWTITFRLANEKQFKGILTLIR